jgi:O-antigen/teichoic acid export membrane protein
MGREFDYAGNLVIVFASINVVLLAEQSLWAWCFNATGNLRKIVAPSIAAAVLNFAASVFLTDRIGLAGPIIGTTIGCTAVGLWILPWKLKQVFGTSPGALAFAVLGPTAWGTFAATGLWMLTRQHQPSNLPWLGVEMGMSALVVLAIGFAGFLPAEEKAHWRVRLAALVPRGA